MRGLMLVTAALLSTGCTFHEIEVEEASSISRADRAERNRAEVMRLPTECRDDRVDRRDQSDGCQQVVRRGS